MKMRVLKAGDVFQPVAQGAVEEAPGPVQCLKGRHGAEHDNESLDSQDGGTVCGLDAPTFETLGT